MQIEGGHSSPMFRLRKPVYRYVYRWIYMPIYRYMGIYIEIRNIDIFPKKQYENFLEPTQSNSYRKSARCWHPLPTLFLTLSYKEEGYWSSNNCKTLISVRYWAASCRRTKILGETMKFMKIVGMLSVCALLAACGEKNPLERSEEHTSELQ